MLIGDDFGKEEILQEIQIHCMEWQYVKEHGSASIIWSDGRELNFIRQKIIRLKERLEDEADRNIYETPPKMGELFMVNPQAIEKEAKEALKDYESDQNYRYLLVNKNRLPEAYRMQTEVDAVLDQMEKFRKAVYYHHYIAMKKYLNVNKYRKMFTACRKELESLLAELEDLGEIEEIKPKVIYQQMNLEEIIHRV